MLKQSIALLAGIAAVITTVQGCTSSPAKPPAAKQPERAISKLSPTERELLLKEVGQYPQVSEPEATIEKWCAATNDEMLQQVVKGLSAGTLQELSVAAVGIRRACDDRRRNFTDALEKAEAGESKRATHELKKTVLGL